LRKTVTGGEQALLPLQLLTGIKNTVKMGIAVQ